MHVRRFAPAEFEGLPSTVDPLDRGRSIARQWLKHYEQHIQSTVFVCGIFYERFQPGGLNQARIRGIPGIGGEGDFILDCRSFTAQVLTYDSNDSADVTICMTALQDVARFVTRALDLPFWPSELRMCGERIRVRDLVHSVQRLMGEHSLAHTTKNILWIWRIDL